MTDIIATVRDSNLKLTLAFGIGLHHAGLHERDRKTVEELFVNCKIQVLPRGTSVVSLFSVEWKVLSVVSKHFVICSLCL